MERENNDWKEMLEIIIEDLIDDVTGEYSQEMYNNDYKKLETFVEKLLQQERQRILEEVIKKFDMLRETDRVEKWFILAILKKHREKL